MQIPLSKPDITDKEIQIVDEVLRSDTLSIGPKIQQFEQMFCDYYGVKHAIAVNSGTSGLHLLIKAIGIEKGDEVITTPFSFVASTNCILFEEATPVFVDIDPKTFNMDISKIEEKITDKTKAILPVDVFGQPVNMEAIRRIADRYGLKVIEDSCEAMGGEWNHHKAGTLADGAVFAFYANKQMTTAEGGMIITNDDHIASMCRSLRNQGRDSMGIWLHHEQLGYNYRMSELHAALGVVQMERIKELLDKRAAVARLYNEILKDVHEIDIPYIDPKVSKMSWFIYVIRLKDRSKREEVMKKLEEQGIASKPYFLSIHLQPYIRDQFGFKEGDFPICEEVASSTLALPFYSQMKKEEVEYVCEVLKKVLLS